MSPKTQLCQAKGWLCQPGLPQEPGGQRSHDGHAGASGSRADRRAEDADVIVVNTCSFIDSAQQESVNTILEMARHKTDGRAEKLVVAGCLVERFRDEIRKNIPEVDAVVGTGELEKILAAAGIAPDRASQILRLRF